jgi:hypothetical protein
MGLSLRQQRRDTAKTGPTDLDYSEEFRKKLEDPLYQSPLVDWVQEVQTQEERKQATNLFSSEAETFFQLNKHRGLLYTLKKILGNSFKTLVKDGKFEFIVYETQFRLLTKHNYKKVKDLKELGYKLEPVTLFKFQDGRVFMMGLKIKGKVNGLLVEGVGVGVPIPCHRVVGVDVQKNHLKVLAHNQKFMNKVQNRSKKK